MSQIIYVRNFKNKDHCQKRVCCAQGKQLGTAYRSPTVHLPNGIYVVETISNERYEVVPGNGPRYAIKNDTTKGYSEFISIE